MAANRGIALETINVEIQRQTDTDGPCWETSFAVRLDLGEGLISRERAAMLGSARRCKVQKLLSRGLHVNYGWVEEA